MISISHSGNSLLVASNFFSAFWIATIRVWITTSTIAMLIVSLDTLGADPRIGKNIYDRNCASCHGDTGRGVIPNTVDFSRGEGLLRSDRELLREIQQGRRAMPGFKTLLTESEILDVVAYLRTLF